MNSSRDLSTIFSQHPHWSAVKEICAKIRQRGFKAWLAGGCVRDGLMRVVPHDFDVATDASPKEIEDIFERTVDVGKAFGVMRVIHGLGDVEVATFRKDGIYKDGRHPVGVELSNPEQDAKRRDFTVNALFYDLVTCEIIDYVGGEKDIKARVIRTVGAAALRFNEDRLRILRAVRFVAQLDFTLDKSTYEGVCRLAPEVDQLKFERIHDEMNKLFRGQRPDRGIELLMNSGLMRSILPEVELDWQVNGGSENFFTRLYGQAQAEDLGWLFLIKSIRSVVDQEKVFKRFKFSNEKKGRINNAMKLTNTLLGFNALELSDKKKVAADVNVDLALNFIKLNAGLPIVGLSDFSLVNSASNKGGQDSSGEIVGRPLENRSQSQSQCGGVKSLGQENGWPGVLAFIASHRKLPARLIEAQDLIALGVKPGQEMGRLIEKCFEAQLNETISTKTEALAWLKPQIKKT